MLYSCSRFSWEPSEIGAAKPDEARLLREAPAAFRRLCVETAMVEPKYWKPLPAAFRRLCVETNFSASACLTAAQPPSGGCVLKPFKKAAIFRQPLPAAFRRLCVETWPTWKPCTEFYPAAFRRLCVETATTATPHQTSPPAAFRRLCVETSSVKPCLKYVKTSRLQAAVC